MPRQVEREECFNVPRQQGTPVTKQVNDDGDIYIMMQCVSVSVFVTKNEHFLKRSVCLFVMLQESDKSQIFY